MNDTALETPPADAAAPLTADDLWTVETERQAETRDAAEAEQAAAVTEEPAKAASETPAVDQPRDQSGQFAPKAKKPRDDPRARVEQATAREAAAKAEAAREREEVARLRAELDTVRRGQTAPRQEPTPDAVAQHATRPKPTEDEVGTKYQTYAEFTEDLADWKFEVRTAERDAKAKADAAQRESETLLATYRERAHAFAATVPDFQQAFDRVQDIEVPPALAHALMTSEKGPQFAYHLATHREEYAQLVQDIKHLSADAAPMVRRLLDAQIQTSAAAAAPDSARGVRPSAAQPPINRVGGTASATPLDPDDLDFGPDYIRRENAREKKEREARRW